MRNDGLRSCWRVSLAGVVCSDRRGEGDAYRSTSSPRSFSILANVMRRREEGLEMCRCRYLWCWTNRDCREVRGASPRSIRSVWGTLPHVISWRHVHKTVGNLGCGRDMTASGLCTVLQRVFDIWHIII